MFTKYERNDFLKKDIVSIEKKRTNKEADTIFLHKDTKETTDRRDTTNILILKKEREVQKEDFIQGRVQQIVEEVMEEKFQQQRRILEEKIGIIYSQKKEATKLKEEDRIIEEASEKINIEKVYEQVYEKIERALRSERRRLGQ